MTRRSVAGRGQAGAFQGGLAHRGHPVALRGSVASTVASSRRRPRTDRSAVRSVVGRPRPPYMRRAQGGSSADRGGGDAEVGPAGRAQAQAEPEGAAAPVSGTGGTVRKSAVSTPSLVRLSSGRIAS